MTRLLKYPYPYRAALSICSDIDECPAERFVEIHEHFDKIGLEVGDSFFFHASPDQLNWRDHRDIVLEGLRRGWIDAIHGIGDFNGKGGFTRAMSERALGELEAAGFRLTIFSNHGDPHNSQNLCHTGGRGDVPGAPEYHADLLIRHGVRFVWPTWLSHIVGQDRDSDAWEWCRTYPDVSQARRIGAGLLAAMGFIGMVEPYPGNELVKLHTLRDGSKVYAFLRHGVWRRDDVPSLAAALAPERLRQLIEVRGASILYTHLGRRWSPLPEFERLKDLWVVRPSRLLRFVVMRDGLRWTARDGLVTIEAHVDPVLGKITEADLAGLSFEGAREVFFDGRPVRVEPKDDVVRIAG